MDELFSDAANLLASYPEMGKIGKISGTRELIPHENYRLVYELDDSTVWVLAWCMWPGSGLLIIVHCPHRGCFQLPAVRTCGASSRRIWSSLLS